ncbi:deoxycytidylate deaminase [Caudoviricetes sp.]|nr:deoxycytidylate deaminase [Caudoviricetes sp.]
MITQQDRSQMELVIHMAQNSNCAVKVGACVHLPEKNYSQMGYNTERKGGGGIMHAEYMALGGESTKWEGATLYITKFPCLPCCLLAINAGVKRIVTPAPYEINPRTGQPSKWYQSQICGLEELKASGVTVDFVDIKMNEEGIPMFGRNKPIDLSEYIEEYTPDNQHNAHYTKLGNYEPFKVFEAFVNGNDSLFRDNPSLSGYYLQAIKYLGRVNSKDTPVQNLEKAIVYIQEMIKIIQEGK